MSPSAFSQLWDNVLGGNEQASGVDFPSSLKRFDESLINIAEVTSAGIIDEH
jgi:hypothetical protein